MLSDEFQTSSPAAQRGLRRWLRQTRPRQILEVGAGIGTLTRIILAEAPGATFHFIEDSEVCLTLLYRFLPVTAAQRVLDGDVPMLGPYDFVVIDGGTRTSAYYTGLKTGAVVFVEGGRREQRAVLEAAHRGRRRYVHLHVKAWDRSKGYHVYRFEAGAPEYLRAALINARERTLDLGARVLNRFGTSIVIGKRRRRA